MLLAVPNMDAIMALVFTINVVFDSVFKVPYLNFEPLP
jgi:hypothetical protein